MGLFTKLEHWVQCLQGKKILICGDMVADIYLEGKISRISREAPVLVLEYQEEVLVPGGAANVVHNAATLGGEVYAVGLVGDDPSGRKMKSFLREKGVHVDGLLEEADRPTITKTRVMAGGLATVKQQVVRIDKEKKAPLEQETETALCEYIARLLPGMDAVVVSDYGSGAVTPAIWTTVRETCHRQQIPCAVDSRYTIAAYQGATVIKQNEAEAAAAVGKDILTTDEEMEEAGQVLVDKLQAEVILLTQGPDGMTVFQRGKAGVHIPAVDVSEVFDVSGAGDTVVVTMMLAVAAGASYVEAAQLANIAAGVVVRKPGTATVSVAELRAALRRVQQ